MAETDTPREITDSVTKMQFYASSEDNDTDFSNKFSSKPKNGTSIQPMTKSIVYSTPVSYRDQSVKPKNPSIEMVNDKSIVKSHPNSIQSRIPIPTKTQLDKNPAKIANNHKVAPKNGKNPDKNHSLKEFIDTFQNHPHPSTLIKLHGEKMTLTSPTIDQMSIKSEPYVPTISSTNSIILNVVPAKFHQKGKPILKTSKPKRQIKKVSFKAIV